MATQDREWEGPFSIRVDLVSPQTRTVRYRGTIGDRPFDLYVPRMILTAGRANSGLSPALHVVLDRSAASVREVGIRGRRRPLRVEPGVCEFAFAEDRVRSKLYKMQHDQGTFSVYVPNEVFANVPRPERLFLRVFETE